MKGINFEKMSRSKEKERAYIAEEIYESEKDNDFYQALRNSLVGEDALSIDIEKASLKNMNSYFDPQNELQTIAYMQPGGKKEKNMRFYKYRLIEQYKGFALLKGKIIKIIEEMQENLSSENMETLLQGIVDEYQDSYKFSPNQMHIITEMIREFSEKHEAVNNFF